MKLDRMTDSLKNEILRELLGNIHLSAIVAHDMNGVIGKDGKIPWSIPEDMRHFKEYTRDSSLIMGRKTAQSLPKNMKRHGRYLHILSANHDICDEDVPEDFRPGIDYFQYTSVAELLIKLDYHMALLGNTKAVVCGGASVYKTLLPLCEEISITRVWERYEGDTFFPGYIESDYSCKEYRQIAGNRGMICIERDKGF